jgi:hypothetical protein
MPELPRGVGAQVTPDTVHFVAQMVRHNRAMATSFEKWVRKQPPSPACREMLQILAVYRGVLTTLESQIVQFDVECGEREEVEA